jgi:hypothetical protein
MRPSDGGHLAATDKNIRALMFLSQGIALRWSKMRSTYPIKKSAERFFY